MGIGRKMVVFRSWLTGKIVIAFAALFILSLLIAPESSFRQGVNPIIRVEATTTQYQTTSNLLLRKGASMKDKVIETIQKGKIVTFLSKSGSWYKVKYGSKFGYADPRYLKKFEKNMTNPVRAKGYKLPILMYHAIDDYHGTGLKELYVTPHNFEAQMMYLKANGFTPITFEDLKNIQNINKPILITLDDGYKNNINVYKILKKLKSSSFNAKATIFMIGRKIDQKTGLSKNQLKEMSDSGIISIQSHTETHMDLTHTIDYTKELKDIITKLENITGKKVIALSYPAGKYNSAVIAQARKYYQYAVTTKQGIANTASSNFELKRLRVSYSTSLAAFEKMVNQ